MTFLAATGTSVCVRYLLSVNLGPLAGMTNQQAFVFNALDVTISSLAVFLLAKNGANENVQLIFGRGLGFIASLTIASIALGPLNLLVALAVSGVSQFIGLFVNIALVENKSPVCFI